MAGDFRSTVLVDVSLLLIPNHVRLSDLHRASGPSSAAAPTVPMRLCVMRNLDDVAVIVFEDCK